jgi:hypothetical protein
MRAVCVISSCDSMCAERRVQTASNMARGTCSKFKLLSPSGNHSPEQHCRRPSLARCPFLVLVSPMVMALSYTRCAINTMHVSLMNYALPRHLSTCSGISLTAPLSPLNHTRVLDGFKLASEPGQ